MKPMRRLTYGLAILVSASIVIALQPWACFHHKPKTFVAWMGQLYRPGPADMPGAMESLHELPPPDWLQPWLWSKIPSVILTSKGAYINGAATPVPFNGVIGTLASIPSDQWPCGRLILFVPFQPGAPDRSAPLEIVQTIMAELKEAAIAYPSFTGKD